MSKNEYKVSSEELEQFNKFMQVVSQQLEKDPNFAMKIIGRLQYLMPKETLLKHLESIKGDKQLLDNYQASNHGVTQEMFTDNVDKIQKILSGETTTFHDHI